MANTLSNEDRKKINSVAYKMSEAWRVLRAFPVDKLEGIDKDTRDELGQQAAELGAVVTRLAIAIDHAKSAELREEIGSNV